jgi:hypothetical protein
MHKTGSTSIQKSLRGFSDDFFVYYDDHKGRTNHGGAVIALLGTTGGGQRLKAGKPTRQRPRDAQVLRRLDAAFRSLGDRTLVLSGEAMVFLIEDELRELRDYVRAHVKAVEVVAYVRPPAAYVTSVAQQRSKGIRGPEENHTRFEPENLYPRYRLLFEKLDAVFGRENVCLWKFDPASFPDGCVVQDFCTRLGVALPRERVVRVNESISREAVQLLFTYRKLGREFGALNITGPQNKRLIDALNAAGRARFRISPDVLRPMLEHNRSDIEWMEQRLGESLHEELQEHQPGDVREEWDLLRPNPDVVAKLRTMLGDAVPAGVNGTTPEEVAMLVHALRGKLERQRVRRSKTRWRSAGRRDSAEVQIADRIEGLGQAKPGAPEEMPRQDAEAPVRGVFPRVNASLRRMQQGIVAYSGFGLLWMAKGGGREREAPRSRIGLRPAEQGRAKR